MSAVLYQLAYPEHACGLPEITERPPKRRVLARCEECGTWYEWAGTWVKLLYDPRDNPDWVHSEPYAGDEK
jgi:hypothetical protein